VQQMREAFPWDQAPRYVLRDRDAIYGRDFACHDPRYGNGGSAYCTAIPLAKSICGTTGGLYPSRVSGPRYRVEREIVANSAQPFCLLLAVTNAFSLGQRRPGAHGSGTAGTEARGSDSTGGRITPPISATRRLAGASQSRRCLPS
jgi:hypothetical protein